MIKKIAKKISSVKSGICVAIAGFVATSIAKMPVVFGAKTASAQTAMANVLGIFSEVAKWAGIGLLAWGIISLALSILNDEPTGKAKVIMLIVSGIVLIGAKALIQAVTGIEPATISL